VHTVSEIFATKGEPYFRNREAELLRHLNGKEKTIVACGGGTVCFSGNLEWMKEHGTIVWLKAAAILLLEILKNRRHEPLLMNMSDEEMRTFIETKLTERESFYEQAGIILNAEEASDDSLDLWLR
jgi:shikimate kinase